MLTHTHTHTHTHRHTHRQRETEAASSDTRARIIIISDAFNILGLSFEDNLWGILNLTILFCPGFLSQTKTLLISAIPIGRVFIFWVFPDIIKDAADSSHPASSSSSSVVLLSESAIGGFSHANLGQAFFQHPPIPLTAVAHGRSSAPVEAESSTVSERLLKALLAPSTAALSFWELSRHPCSGVVQSLHKSACQANVRHGTF